MPLQGLLARIEHALAPVRHVMKPLLSDPLVMGVWALFVLASVGTLCGTYGCAIGRFRR